MTGEAWIQIGATGALFAVVIFLAQATIRGTWRPRAWTKELLDSKQELLDLKSEQLAVVTAERDKMLTAIDVKDQQISGLTDALGAMKHFFQEVPVVPSKGDIDETSET